MSPSTQHVAITPLGPAEAAAVTWLLRGQLHVTIVVKATFALVPEGRMSLMKPEPVAPDEQPDPSGRWLRTAGDLAPYRAQCDVVVTGHAELPPGFSSPEVMVRLTVVQGGQVRIDKQAQLDGSVRVGAGRSHVRIDGMGPLSRASPPRSRLLGGVDARRLAGLWLDIPEGLDGSYFQAAPADQRLGALRGDEWIVLGGMIAQRPKLRTQLPEARGAARLYRRHGAAPRAGEPIALRADTVHVDVDRRCCSVVWRGHRPVEAAELASLRVLAGVELPGQPAAWADPFGAGGASAAGAAPPEAASRRGDRGGALQGTSHLSLEEAARVVAAPVTPFDPWRAPARAARSSAAPPAAPAAAAAHRSEGPAPRARESDAPAEAAPVAGAAPRGERAPRGEATPRGETAPPGETAVLGETSQLSLEEAARAAASSSTPFGARRAPAAPARAAAPRPAAPAASHPAAAPRAAASSPARHGARELLGETSALSVEEAAKAIAFAATPFDARRAPAAAAAEPARRPASSSAPPAPPAPLAPAPPAVAPAQAAPPLVQPPGLGVGDARGLPKGLGAQFLAAMADVDLASI
ncbi:DUF2169 domain-containing protein [Sorangium sp. So ce834]|uniref:DUF2169 domain-containing protein n=1 Tax=Sorangium sp. So ce834 TaxID=3133321 RepID=UPI003F5EB359